jgi:hypothetical protein
MRAVLGALAIGILGLQLHPIAQSSSLPFLGEWKMNVNKIDLSQVRVSFTRKASSEITMTSGPLAYDFRVDGKPYPAPPSFTVIWTETGTRTWRALYRLNNVDNNIDNLTLSPDGKTLTVRSETLIPSRTEIIATYTRVGTGDGLFGTWQQTSAQANYVPGLTFSVADGGKVQWRSLPDGFTAVLTPDGTEAPVTGPPAALLPGEAMPLKITGARTFDLTTKVKGLVTVDHASVSGDGRTMTFDEVSGPPGPRQEHVTFVFERK